MKTFDPGDPRKDRDHFLEMRKPYFTASNTSVLFNRHPFTTAADYWMEKTVGAHAEETMAMRRGQELESALLGWYAREHDRDVKPSHLTYTVGRLAATPDGWAGELPIEIKTTSLYTDGTPQQYWLDQCQTQMICTETDVAILIWMDASLNLYTVEVQADPILQAEIITKANTFMEAVEAELMPDYIALEAEHVIRMHPAPQGSTDGGEDGKEAAAAYHGHKQAEKYHKAQAAEMRDVIAATMLDYDTLTYDDNPIVTFKPRETPEGFDKTRFKEEHPGLFEEYTTPPGVTRVIHIPKKAKEMFDVEQ